MIIWKTDKRANRAINTIVIFHFNNGTELAEMSGYNGEWREMTREHLWCTFYVLWGTMRPKALHHHYAHCRCTHANTHLHTNTHTHCIYNPHSYTHACMYRHETFGILIWYEIKLFEQLVESLLCQALPGATAFCFMINHALTLCVCVSVITELKNSMYREKRLIMMVWRGTPGAGVQSRGGMDRTCGRT